MPYEPAQSSSGKASQSELEREYDATIMEVKVVLRYQPTREEQLVLDECNAESMQRRSIPLSLLFGFAAYSACKRGLLKANTRLGLWLHVAGFGASGFIAGRLLYVTACKEKVLEKLPNSNLAKIIRTNGQVPSEFVGKSNDYPGDSFQPNISSSNSQETSFDTSGSNYPAAQNSLARSQTTNDQQPPSTFAELRQMNRRTRPNPRPLPSQSAPDSSSANQPPENGFVDSIDVPVARSKPKVTNKYGDAWEN